MSQMFKKLQNLLFEDEEVVEEEVINEPEPVKPAPRPVQTNTNTQRPVMHQVDPAPAQNSAPQVSFFRQEKTEPAPAPAPAPAPTPVQERPRTIGMTVDDVQDETMNLQLRPSSKLVTPAQQPKPQPKPQQTAQTKKKPQPVYEFSPVISPIFGVDEKDLDALKTSGKTQVVMPGKEDTNVSPVISPMYGMSKEAEPKTIQDTVEKSNELAENLLTEEKQKAEESIPDFSLDDILKIRDDEYKETAEQATLFDDIIDETVIFDSDKYNRR
ncbi:MAG: hypothetical protein IIZ27_07470 [Solobacterium sp.]|nr:hypothetical protein [Solobacterium sp.]